MVHRNISDIEIPFFTWKKLKSINEVYPNIAFDTETIDGRCFLISDSNRRTVYIDDLYTLLSYLNAKEYRKTCNWFYNLEYDTNAILKYLSFEDRKEIALNNIIDYEEFKIQIIPKKELKIGKIGHDDKMHNATFSFDLAQFYDMQKLKNLALKTQYRKVEVDDIQQINVEKYKTNTEYHQLINDRVEYDCLIAKELADQFTSSISPIVKINKYRSKASIARRYVLENLKRSLKVPNKTLIQSALNAYHAGHIEACKLGIFKNIFNYDLNCFDTDTELLTIDGFKKWDKITMDDKAATLNLETSDIEYQKVLHIFKYQYDGNLLYQKNENLDIMATPNHRIYYKVKNRSKNGKNYGTYSDYKVSMLRDLPHGNIKIPTNGMQPKGIKPNIDIDMIKLCAWVITEGTLRKKGDGIVIYQSDKYNYQNEIRKIVKNCDISYSERNRGIREGSNYNSYEFEIHVLDGKYIRELLNNKKEIPKEWVLTWDKEYLEILFLELMKGDGTFRCQKGKAAFRSYNDHDLDMMNLIAFKIGYKSSINYKTHDLNIKVNRDSNYATTQTNQKREEITYKGIVWCVTTPNDTIVVRRNGKIFITGNSAYPSFTADLYDTDGIFKHNQQYEPDTAYSFYLINIDYQDDNLTPIWINSHQKNYHPNGNLDIWVTQPELEFFMTKGFDYKIKKAYHLLKRKNHDQPFNDLVHYLYEKRLEAKKDHDPIQQTYKIILNSIYGVTINTISKNEISEVETNDFRINKNGEIVFYKETFKATNMYNPLFGAYITAQTRIKLFTDFYKHLDKLISVNTDGVYLISKSGVKVSKKLGDYSLDKIDKIMVLGSGRYFSFNENGNVNNNESKFRSIPKNPSEIYDMMVHNHTDHLSISRDKPIKLKESVKIKAYKDRFNEFRNVTKNVFFKIDRRVWFDQFETIDDIFDKQINSRPYNVDELD